MRLVGDWPNNVLKIMIASFATSITDLLIFMELKPDEVQYSSLSFLMHSRGIDTCSIQDGLVGVLRWHTNQLDYLENYKVYANSRRVRCLTKLLYIAFLAILHKKTQAWYF